MSAKIVLSIVVILLVILTFLGGWKFGKYQEVSERKWCLDMGGTYSYEKMEMGYCRVGGIKTLNPNARPKAAVDPPFTRRHIVRYLLLCGLLCRCKAKRCITAPSHNLDGL